MESTRKRVAFTAVVVISFLNRICFVCAFLSTKSSFVQTRPLCQLARQTTSSDQVCPSTVVGDENNGEVFPVPASIQNPRAAPCSTFGTYYSLEDLFPGSGLADKFDNDADFRRSIRVAARDDLYIPNPKWTDEVNALIKDLGSTLLVDWRSSPTDYAALTALFRGRGVALTGRDFVLGLGALCRPAGAPSPVGSLTDIVRAGARSGVAHSWHQDAGTPTFTAMLGFPDRNNYEGVGVFSHIVKLSHPLKQLNEEGSVIEWENYPAELFGDAEIQPQETIAASTAEGAEEGGGGAAAAASSRRPRPGGRSLRRRRAPAVPSSPRPSPSAAAGAGGAGEGGAAGRGPRCIPEEHIVRPVYRRGQEVLVYRDSDHLHSAPDEFIREALWRFM